MSSTIRRASGRFSSVFAVISLILWGVILTASRSRAGLAWETLPEIPDRTGLAAPFAGVAGGGLVVAGGANFPEAAPWDGGAKIWHDQVFILDDPAGSWREAGRLPRALAYGVSVTIPGGVLCIGGSDADRHHADCFVLKPAQGKLTIEPFPALPEPLANMAGTVLGNTVWIVGGTTSPNATTASNALLALDLDNLAGGWKNHAPLPGPGRILPVVGARSGAFFVFSGASLAPDAGGKAVRTYLRDAWRFDPRGGWTQVPDLPRAAVAAPSPALAVGGSHLFVIGGDDGSHVDFEPKSQHPGFSREILAFDAVTKTWVAAGSLTETANPPVTVPVVQWRGRFVIPSGEIRPAVRTAQVLSGKPFLAKAAFGWFNWTVVAVYLAGMIGIGVWFMKREAASTTEAYFRGGQRVPAWVAGLSIFATMLSSLTFMGIPARVYQTDVSWYVGQLPILLIVPLVIFFYLPFFRG
jgi:solute:Na+ symporter, SSS family